MGQNHRAIKVAKMLRLATVFTADEGVPMMYNGAPKSITSTDAIVTPVFVHEIPSLGV